MVTQFAEITVVVLHMFGISRKSDLKCLKII